jgi:hypothetical protein
MSDQIDFDDDAKKAVNEWNTSLYYYLCWAIVSATKYPPWDVYEKWYSARKWDED